MVKLLTFRVFFPPLSLIYGLPPCALLLEGPVDGRNQLLAEPALRSEFEPLFRAYKNLPGTLLIRTGEDSPNLVQWLLAHL